MWTVEFYERSNGDKPVEKFINKLDKKMRAKAIKEIEILRQTGNSLREPYSKHLQDGIFELRIKFSSDISRVFYFFYIGNRIILTNGFIKKTQKTPPNEIELAINYRQDFIERERMNDDD